MKIYYPPTSTLEGNELKTFVQLDVAEKLRVEHELILEAATGFGKTFAGITAMVKLQPTSTLIIVPTITLKQQWESSTISFINVEVIVVNSLVFHATDTKRKFGLVIADEGHRILNKESEWFSTALDVIESEKTLVLSATLNREHIAFLVSKRPNIGLYKISLGWCYKNKLVPNHININVPVDLTLEEKSNMIKVQTEYDKYARLFAGYKIFNPYIQYGELDFMASDCPNAGNAIDKSEWTKGQLIGMVNKWRVATTARKNILQRATNKHYVVNDFLQKVRNEKLQKVLIFGKTIEVIEQVVVNNNDKATCFHSKHGAKQKKEIFREFFADEKPFLASINTIIEGFDMKTFAEAMGFSPDSTSVQLSIRLAYDASELKTIQAFGRILRYNPENPDQQVIQVNLYVNDFSIRGKEYKSQEKKWLLENLKSQIKVLWVDSVDEIVL